MFMDRMQVSFMPNRVDQYRDAREIQKCWRRAVGWQARNKVVHVFIYIGLMVAFLTVSMVETNLHVPATVQYVAMAIVTSIIYIKLVVPGRLRKLAEHLDEIDRPELTDLMVDGRGVAIVNSAESIEVRWAAVRDIQQLRRGVGVITTALLIHIPNSAFRDDAERASLIAFAKEQLALQARP
jgi:hypothetical protein